MNRFVIGAVSALALCGAAPAVAQSTGSATVGGGIGVGLGGFSNGSISSGTTSGGGNASVNGTIANELSASSGSGFGGTMNINSVPGGSSYAVVGGIGEAGTSIMTGVDPTGVGSITSTSYNGGLYGGLTGGNASLSMQVMNFGQSSADYKFNMNFAAAANQTFDTSTQTWDVAGALCPSLFGFETAGWNVQ